MITKDKEKIRYLGATAFGKAIARSMDDCIDPWIKRYPLREKQNRKFWLSFCKTLRSTLDGIELVVRDK